MDESAACSGTISLRTDSECSFSATAVLSAFWANTVIISLSGGDLLQSWRLLRLQLMSVTTQTQSPRCLLRNKANRRSAKAISPSAKFDDADSIFREQQLHFFKQPTTLQNDLSNPRWAFIKNPCCKSAWEHVGLALAQQGMHQDSSAQQTPDIQLDLSS